MLIGGDLMQDGERLYKCMMEKMRYSSWRTANGAFYQICTNINYKTVGHGRLTLWPALLDSTVSSSATYPISYSGPTGTVTVLFDTTMALQDDPMVRLSGPIRASAADRKWILSNGNRCGLRWLYTGDAMNSANSFRIIADRCVADPWNTGQYPKKFAGDGMSCGRNYEWSF
jgi:hypothetical protein